MLYTTRGIVIHTVRYAESSVIAKIYTETFGLKTYIFRGVYKARARVRPNLLQHLNLIEMVTDNREFRGIQNPRELRIEHPFKTLPFDVRKSSVALYINEMLFRSIRHEEPDQALFDFIRNSIIWFDDAETIAVNFHLWFCIHLTRFLGFFPGRSLEEGDIFDLSEGNFRKNIPVHGYYMDKPLSSYFRELINCNAETIPNLTIPRLVRSELVEQIINYYKLHITDFGIIQSHKVLADVLS
jgi:DNA repair protein RecO (recombination protein O)